MRKIFTLVGAGLLCLFGTLHSASAQNRFRPDNGRLEEVQKVVLSSRDAWQELFPANELPDYGFRDQQEKKMAVPGKPIEVYAMYRTFEGKIETQPTGEFLVPLLIDGRPRVFLTVAFFENRYQVVAVGEMNLAQEATAYLSQPGSDKKQHIWLRNLNHAADFIADANSSLTDASLHFMPLSTARRASFREPIAYPELVNRIGKMIVQFD
jgi:hypothetical protein